MIQSAKTHKSQFQFQTRKCVDHKKKTVDHLWWSSVFLVAPSITEQRHTAHTSHTYYVLSHQKAACINIEIGWPHRKYRDAASHRCVADWAMSLQPVRAMEQNLQRIAPLEIRWIVNLSSSLLIYIYRAYIWKVIHTCLWNACLSCGCAYQLHVENVKTGQTRLMWLSAGQPPCRWCPRSEPPVIFDRC